MKAWLLGLIVVLAGCHSTDGSCCSNADCPGNFVCSAACTTTDKVEGICLKPCFVDPDCGSDAVCNSFVLNCGCEPIGDAGGVDAGHFGTCSGGVGD